MAGIESNTPGFLPFDNTALRQRLAQIPLRTTSIEAELRAVMAERRAEQAEAKPKRTFPLVVAPPGPSSTGRTRCARVRPWNGLSVRLHVTSSRRLPQARNR